MVVYQIDVHDIRALELEHQSPISGYPYCPLTLAVASQLVEAIAWCGHILRRFCCAEGEQQPAQLGSVLSIDASGCSGREELLQALVAEALDYIMSGIT